MDLPLSKRIARKIVFPVVVGLNLEKLFSFLHHHNKLILVYHGVVETPNHLVSVGPIAVKQLNDHFSYFKHNYNVVSQEEIFQMYREDFKPGKKTIAITFDDGYENNFTRAFPLLKKYNFPATMYIISRCIEDDTQLTWYDYIDVIKHKLDVDKINVSAFNRQKLHSISELKTFIKTLNIDQRNILYTEIGKQVNIEENLSKYPRENWKLMDKRELQEISKSDLIELGAHTHNHPNLGEIKIEDAQKEVTYCKQLIESTIQKEVRSLAFPDGSYTDEVKRVCLDAGYKNLLAVDYRCPSDTEDKNILQRYCISATTTFESNIIQVNRQFKNYGF